ncbi:pyridoxamine 5'-phosphate oxidase family protein [Nocardioides sp. GY 10127]|uniref:pyridoxamine 5'-phosphate oxidase family protein n=1 Tax=Nocardioides sp. GY 10127 TaxID=2569762 RepID=UPI0010A80DC8|nr:pyridoxamine 5'-phosphate oxidase family protein [Nocardioides sp. GY 10127]TIC80745.1 pyridoxamine 5'-phosphate oxidase family protein [Nocardioides sp. GY 10127]
MTTLPLQPTPRTSLTRSRHRALDDREALHACLREALIGHLGVTVGEGDGAHPVVLPVAVALDESGPDEGGTLYVHGSVAAGWLASAVGRTVCLTVTHLDGLVLARSGFHHSMNYRSAVVIGALRRVEDEDERLRALDLVVDHLVPGRAATLRPMSRKELAATVVLALPLAEASLKVRDGGPVDDDEDVAAGAWAGHLPLRTIAGDVVPDAHSADLPVPVEVGVRADSLR